MLLTERQKRILLTIVRKYMDDGEPVSSGFVTSQLGNDLSSATIRNEMAELSAMGYLQQPHVSAGRVPTVLAYHMYISMFLVEATRRRMFTGPLDLPLQYESLPRLFDGVASAVSDRTKKVSFVLSPPMNSVTLRHVSLVPFSETVLMLIFITDRENVDGYKLQAPAGTTEQELADINAILAKELRGKTLDEGIRTIRFGNVLPQGLAIRYGTVLDAIAELMEGELRKGESQIFVRGIEQMLSDLPDDQVGAFSTLSTFLSREEVVKPFLNSLSDRGEISLFIGDENPREELKSFSLVSVRYSLESNLRGILGVVGPIRMNYIRAITVLESFAGYLGRVSGRGRGMPAFEAGQRLSPGERVTLSGSESAHHIAEVLRVRNGDTITLFHDGALYEAVVSDASRSSLAATVVAARPAPLADRPIALLQAVIRPALLDDVVRGCSPLGVTPFTFYAAERGQPWNAAGRLERLDQVALAAVEQAETGRRPTVELVADLERALARLDHTWRVLYLSPRAPSTVSALMRDGLLSLDSPIAMAVGPEGGFTVHEEALLDARGAVSVRLNTGILRSELAGFAAGLILRELQGLS